MAHPEPLTTDSAELKIVDSLVFHPEKTNKFL